MLRMTETFRCMHFNHVGNSMKAYSNTLSDMIFAGFYFVDQCDQKTVIKDK